MTEEQEQIQFIKYAELQYPGIEFRVDKDGQFARGKALWSKAKQKGKKGFPDVVIPVPRGTYTGLVIEMKRSGEAVYKKDGGLRKDDHLEDQQWWLNWFKSCGCHAVFCIGFDEAKQVLDNYMREKL